MAFPANGILSSFTGTDEEPLSEGGAWVGPIRTVTATRDKCRRSTNQVTCPTVGTVIGESVYNTTFNADQEVFCTVATVPGTLGHTIQLYMRVLNESTSSVTSYQLVYGIAPSWEFWRLSGTSFTQIGTTLNTTTTVSAGDSIGCTVIGSSLEAWYKPAAGAWTSIGTRSDTTYSNSGKLGVVLTQGSVSRIDDFGGGNADTSPPFPTMPVITSGLRW